MKCDVLLVNQKVTTLRKLIDSGNFSPEEIQQYLEKSSARKQSKIGAEISDIITRRVIIGVFLMLCVVPFLTYSSPVDDEKEATMFLHEINIRADMNCAYLGRAAHSFRSIIDELGGSQGHPFLLALSVSPPRCEGVVPINFSNEESMRGIRREAIRTISTDPATLDGGVYSVSASFNLKPYMEHQAKFGICLMVFVLFMFAMLSIQITGDAQRLVLAPIENMMAMSIWSPKTRSKISTSNQCRLQVIMRLMLCNQPSRKLLHCSELDLAWQGQKLFLLTLLLMVEAAPASTL